MTAEELFERQTYRLWSGYNMDTDATTLAMVVKMLVPFDDNPEMFGWHPVRLSIRIYPDREQSGELIKTLSGFFDEIDQAMEMSKTPSRINLAEIVVAFTFAFHVIKAAQKSNTGRRPLEWLMRDCGSECLPQWWIDMQQRIEEDAMEIAAIRLPQAVA